MIKMKDVYESICCKSIRKIMYISDSFVAISGTGFIIKFQEKFYFCCLYHCMSNEGKFEKNKLDGLSILYKTYLEIDPKTISESNVANYVLFPNFEQFTKEFCSSKIDDDLMLDEEFIPIEIIGENKLIPCGYLDFDNKYWRKYLFSEKEPIEDEILLVCGFPFSDNEIDYTDDSKIKKVSHQVHIYAGKCKKDDVGFFVEKEDKNVLFDCNGVSGGIVMRMIDGHSEWVGIAVRANNDIIRFIPYYLVAKSIIKNILDRNKQV